jgi:dTDP-4-dehydrorhamnose 3,5-epimerase
MRFTPTPLADAWVIDLDRIEDERGYFARTWCAREFNAHSLEDRVVQCSTSFNAAKGTLRGLHYQVAPHAETKLVRCTRGAVFDVIADLRPSSATFLRWFGVELTADNGRMLYIPKGFAHGFQTLAERSEVFYQMDEFYAPTAGRGIRWNDPLLGVRWPLEVTVISEKDRGYRDASAERFVQEPPAGP